MAVFCQTAAETLIDKERQTVAQGFKAHMVDDIVQECVLKQQTCFSLFYAALTHVKKCHFIELSYRRTMITLHIVCIYLKHGLAICARVVACTEIGIGLFALCLHGTLAY